MRRGQRRGEKEISRSALQLAGLLLVLASAGCNARPLPLAQESAANKPLAARIAIPFPNPALRRPAAHAVSAASAQQPGDDYYLACESATTNPAWHTLTLDADLAECGYAWTIYELLPVGWQAQDWLAALSMDGELPDCYWLGVADFSCQRWQWRRVEPAAADQLLAVDGVGLPVSDGCAYFAVVVDASRSLTVRTVGLLEGCAAPTAGFGCDLAGRAQLSAGWRVAWGDLHAHSAYSRDAADYEQCLVTPGQACAFARDEALLDFVAITDHAEASGTGSYTQELWWDTLQQEITLAEEYPSERSIVIFPGFEYTKPDPMFGPGGGHKNIIFRDFSCVPSHAGGSDVYAAPHDLWLWLDTTAAAGNYISIPHHPAKGGMRTDWDAKFMNEAAQPLVEVYSRHGSSESVYADDERVHDFSGSCSVGAATSSWIWTHNPAYKLGFVCATDTHDGNPGAVGEVEANVDQRLGAYTGGLAAVWVAAITRDEIWKGLTGKFCYGTSGARIKLQFTGKLAEQYVPMGGTLAHGQHFSQDACGLVNLHISAEGESGRRISRIQLFVDGVPEQDWSQADWGSFVHIDYTDRLETDYRFYRIKVWQEKATNPLPDNIQWERAWSSPIWVEYNGS